MSKQITLSESVSVDLERLLETRMLVQATSGAGKSWLLRRLIEQAGPHCPVIVIDPEGEFHTLRAVLDVVLVGGARCDAAINQKTAAVLARRLVELRTSAVIDLLEMDRRLRSAYVRDFLSSLVSIPRSMYRPIIVVIDEAHVLCPEQQESVATESVIRLMDLGRKRGLCGILATQRLSKLDKDAAAECSNVLIGRTSPIDIKRAADLLGVPQSERNDFTRLDDGEWLGFGPAFASKGINRFHCADTTTRAPKPGSAIEPPRPSSAVAKILPELADLARQDDSEPLTLDEANIVIAGLRKKLATNTKPTVMADGKAVERAVADRDRFWRRRESELLSVSRQHVAAVDKARGLLATVVLNGHVSPASPPDVHVNTRGATKPIGAALGESIGAMVSDVTRLVSGTDSNIPKGERAILIALAQHGRCSRESISVTTGYKRSSRDAYLNRLATKGLVSVGSEIEITGQGVAAIGPDYQPLPSGAELLAHWLQKLPAGESAILRILADNYPQWVDCDDISASTDYKRSSRDAYLTRLEHRKLVRRGQGKAVASEHLFS